MRTHNSVKQTLTEIFSLTDDEKIIEMVLYCLEHIDSIRDEQDRDTRHKCAEAVTKLQVDKFDDLIDIDAAHRACMNAKAIT